MGLGFDWSISVSCMGSNRVFGMSYSFMHRVDMRFDDLFGVERRMGVRVQDCFMNKGLGLRI